MSKRPQSPDLIPNPFIKKRNLDWTIHDSPKAHDDKQQSEKSHSVTDGKQEPDKFSTAAVESGQVTITNHLEHFSTILSSHTQHSPLLSVPDYSELYKSSIGNSNGAHFVIHQHDHPVAGTHYDLRLQINETSSASWAIMYGLPGDPNSKRLNRNATETRIHCLWNHLVETASASTGSLIIWDTGTYTILPRTSKYAPAEDPNSQSSSDELGSSPSSTTPTQQELLYRAFQNRKIRIRLHGSKLPDPYVLNLRLTKPEDAQGRLRSSRVPKFRRKGRRKEKKPEPETSGSSSNGGSEPDEDKSAEDTNARGNGTKTDSKGVQDPHVTSATERELLELEDNQVRLTNAYPGATNTIGSIHQRRWYLSVDRAGSGFEKNKRSSRWELSQETGKGGHNIETQSTASSSGTDRLSWPFHVRGADVERSVVTSRTGNEVLRDEGVTGFVQRKGWKPVLE
ncbi:hypothetical protein CC79DRAFT_1365772 [Sarocladium strictum]